MYQPLNIFCWHQVVYLVVMEMLYIRTSKGKDLGPWLKSRLLICIPRFGFMTSNIDAAVDLFVARYVDIDLMKPSK